MTTDGLPWSPKPRVERAPARAVWTKTHKWGSQLGDSTQWWVSRTDGGEMCINDGKATFTVRREMVEWVAAAVADAAAWSDESPEKECRMPCCDEAIQ